MGLRKNLLTQRSQRPDRVGAGRGKGAIRMDMQDPALVALLVMWGWALSYFLWLVLKKQK